MNRLSYQIIIRARGAGLFAYLAALMLSICPAWGDVIVSGDVSGRWSPENGIYVVIGTLRLAQDDSLVIEPGVRVEFTGHHGFDVFGVLLAAGTEEDSIHFYSSALRPDDWRSIKFSGRGSDAGLMEYCTVKFANRGFELENAAPQIRHLLIAHHDNAGLRLLNSNLDISGCTITNIGANGIAILGSSRPTISDCRISECGDNGIAVIDDASPTISDCYITDVVEYGIRLYPARGADLIGNVLIECGGRGISIEQCSQIELSRNVVYRGYDSGVYVYRSQEITILNNTILDNSESGVFLYNSTGSAINNILTTNGNNGIYAQDSNFWINYNDVWGNGRDDYHGIDPGPSDISESPRLMNPGIGDFHPLEGSPVVDAGDPNYLDPDGTRADIGAWFFNQNHPPCITSWSPESLEEVQGDEEMEFTAQAEDPDEDELTYTWFVNEVESGRGGSFRYTFRRDGDYVVLVVVDDGLYLGQAEHSWSFVVAGCDAPEPVEGLPAGFRLSAPYPNPFNSLSRFEFETRAARDVRITLCNLSGHQAREIWTGVLPAGRHSFSLTATGLPSGWYLLTADTRVSRLTRSVLLVR